MFPSTTSFSLRFTSSRLSLILGQIGLHRTTLAATTTSPTEVPTTTFTTSTTRTCDPVFANYRRKALEFYEKILPEKHYPLIRDSWTGTGLPAGVLPSEAHALVGAIEQHDVDLLLESGTGFGVSMALVGMNAYNYNSGGVRPHEDSGGVHSHEADAGGGRNNSPFVLHTFELAASCGPERRCTTGAMTWNATVDRVVRHVDLGVKNMERTTKTKRLLDSTFDGLVEFAGAGSSAVFALEASAGAPPPDENVDVDVPPPSRARWIDFHSPNPWKKPGRITLFEDHNARPFGAYLHKDGLQGFELETVEKRLGNLPPGIQSGFIGGTGKLAVEGVRDWSPAAVEGKQPGFKGGKLFFRKIISSNSDKKIGVFLDGPKAQEAYAFGRELITEFPNVVFFALHDTNRKVDNSTDVKFYRTKDPPTKTEYPRSLSSTSANTPGVVSFRNYTVDLRPEIDAGASAAALLEDEENDGEVERASSDFLRAGKSKRCWMFDENGACDRLSLSTDVFFQTNRVESYDFWWKPSCDRVYTVDTFAPYYRRRFAHLDWEYLAELRQRWIDREDANGWVGGNGAERSGRWENFASSRTTFGGGEGGGAAAGVAAGVGEEEFVGTVTEREKVSGRKIGVGGRANGVHLSEVWARDMPKDDRWRRLRFIEQGGHGLTLFVRRGAETRNQSSSP
eukprot:g5472.t1